MKKNNPYVPILIREASGTEPRIFARYGRFSQMHCPENAVLIDSHRIGKGEAGVAVW
jgi:hypothetical protein